MSNNIFDLEQQLLSCWHVTDDIKTCSRILYKILRTLKICRLNIQTRL
jgi:hypothetical protein